MRRCLAGTQRADPINQGSPVTFGEFAGTRLEHGVSCPHRKGRKRRFGAFLGKSRNDQHLRLRGNFKDRGQRVEPAHSRHFEIEQHNIGDF
jgi:hypothetical protein